MPTYTAPTPALLQRIRDDLAIGDEEDVVSEAMAQLELPPSLGANTRERVQLICDTLEIPAEWEEVKGAGSGAAAGQGGGEPEEESSGSEVPTPPRKGVSWGRIVVEEYDDGPGIETAVPPPVARASFDATP